VLSSTGGRKAALAALLAALATAGPAAARPDDVPTEVRKPAAGATVADATAGVAVDFTCPVYRQTTDDGIFTEPADGYHVILSSNGLVDANRLLVTTGRVDQRDAVLVDGEPGHCTAAEDDAGHGLLPREPGTYYWQVWRECETYACLGGVEVTDVGSVTVKRTVCSVNRSELGTARAELTSARKALRARRTSARRARVARLAGRVETLRARLQVVYGCRT
jgi:hypothetical protein